jgi:flagellar hook-basal body complex protein FliE
MEVSILLSDEFAEFSSKIQALRDSKNELHEKFKIVLTEYKKNVKEVEEKALKLQEEFESWKEQKLNEVKSPQQN